MSHGEQFFLQALKNLKMTSRSATALGLSIRAVAAAGYLAAYWLLENQTYSDELADELDRQFEEEGGVR